MLTKLKPNKAKALFLARCQLSELVCDAVNLEGINFSLCEVQKLLDGAILTNHRLSDQTIALNQANAWRELFNLNEQDKFSLSKQVALEFTQDCRKRRSLNLGGVSLWWRHYCRYRLFTAES